MHALKISKPIHLVTGTGVPADMRYGLIDNPITYEIVLMIAVVSLPMLLLCIFDCLRPWIAPDGEEDDDYDYEEDAQPRDFTLTEDGDLLENESGEHRHQYYVVNGSWFNADGYVSQFSLLFLFFPKRTHTDLATESK